MSLEDSTFAFPIAMDDFVVFLEDDGAAGMGFNAAPGCSGSLAWLFAANRLRSSMYF
jgi:hypothetical protein